MAKQTKQAKYRLPKGRGLMLRTCDALMRGRGGRLVEAAS